MHYSGILVYAREGQLDDCVRQVGDCAGADVHFAYPDSGRLIAVLESEAVEGQEEGLRRIQNLPSVAAAELVYHYFGDGTEGPPRLDRTTDSGSSTETERSQGAGR